ncbi:MAG: helix-turn-helix transcriptional regulator [Planctomycetes bacterium]|nr:helix-turn-helix transcriptional regulator [Planctomycetota bacterium]
MATPRLPVHQVLRAARREKGWTQARLAQEVKAREPSISIGQSAISMFELGDLQALSQDKVEAIARALGVDLAAAQREARRPPRPAPAPALRFCPNPECPTNTPVVIDGEVRLAPAMVRAQGPCRCSYCSEVLLASCPACRTPVAEGLFCRSIECGRPLVALPEGEAWSSLDAERASRQSVLLLTRARDYPASEAATDGTVEEQNDAPQKGDTGDDKAPPTKPE